MDLNVPGSAARKAATADAFADPQPGDEFEEFYAFWVVVIGRSGDQVTWLECTPPATLPQDGRRFRGTVAEFGAKFAYASIPGYSVKLNRRGINVDGWLR